MAPPTADPLLGDNTRDLLENLKMDDAPKRRPPPPPPTHANGPGTRPENMTPRPRGPPLSLEDERRRVTGNPRGPPGELNIFADQADKSRERRPRRNSDTSIREKTPKLLDPNDDRRKRERRPRDPRRDGKPRGPSRRLDVIDKLDVTSIYGTGLFHHDGPFDACNPHRNRKGSRAAPMQAFPKDSRNMQLGGSGPNNSNIDLAQFHGRGEEGYKDYSTSAVADGYGENSKRPLTGRSASFHPITRVEPLHGEESMGLGTSTFLEGAPASKTAIQRRESDFEEVMNGAGGLSRKKSLAMKIRGISNNRTAAGRPTSPVVAADKVHSPRPTTGYSLHDTNPFFREHDNEHEKKGGQIVFADDKTGRVGAASTSPRKGMGLERRMTGDGAVEEPKSVGGGFLSRVRSLKGGRRKSRGEKRDGS